MEKIHCLASFKPWCGKFDPGLELKPSNLWDSHRILSASANLSMGKNNLSKKLRFQPIHESSPPPWRVPKGTEIDQTILGFLQGFLCSSLITSVVPTKWSQKWLRSILWRTQIKHRFLTTYPVHLHCARHGRPQQQRVNLCQRLPSWDWLPAVQEGRRRLWNRSGTRQDRRQPLQREWKGLKKRFKMIIYDTRHSKRASMYNRRRQWKSWSRFTF